MPNIAIIGKQNVGKSTLFNRLIGQKEAITTSQAGSTRDIIQHELDWGKGAWKIADFPGFEDKKYLREDKLTLAAIEKSFISLKEYHLLLWMVSRYGLNYFEYELHKQLRKLYQKHWLVINFVDDPSLELEATEFYRLGAPRTFFISALNHRNIELLRSEIKKYFFAQKTSCSKTTELKLPAQASTGDKLAQIARIAIIGKPNSGKSTLFNFLLKKESALVSETPGTTRDSLTSKFSFYKRPFMIVDTAGLRRRKGSLQKIDKLSEERTFHNIQKSDIVFLLIDPIEGFDRQIKNIMCFLEKLNKPMIIAINKYDLIRKKSEERKNFLLDIAYLQKQFWKFPVLFISAREGYKVVGLIKAGIKLIEKSNTHYKTPMLNKFLQSLKASETLESKHINLLYLTQKGKKADFILFARKKFNSKQVNRFIIRQLQKFLNIEDIPVSLRVSA